MKEVKRIKDIVLRHSACGYASPRMSKSEGEHRRKYALGVGPPAPVIKVDDMMWVGTSGYNYPEWKGSFYPADLPAAKMLGYYAARFPTVEINYTFYRMP